MNLPNKISLFRFFCTPVMVLLFLLNIPNGIGIFIALGIFVIGSLSDLLDGYIARKYNMVTDFGKFIDQIADKFLATSALILVLMNTTDVVYGWLKVVILLIIVLRDILMSGIRQIAAKNGKVIAADIFGKLKSVFIDVSSMILMLYLGLVNALPNGTISKIGKMPISIIKTIGVCILVIGTTLAVISCINYIVEALPSLKGTGGKSKNKGEGFDIKPFQADTYASANETPVTTAAKVKESKKQTVRASASTGIAPVSKTAAQKVTGKKSTSKKKKTGVASKKKAGTTSKKTGTKKTPAKKQ